MVEFWKQLGRWGVWERTVRDAAAGGLPVHFRNLLMEQARIEHAPNGSLLTYITSADALVNYIYKMLINDLVFQLGCIWFTVNWPQYDRYTAARITICCLHYAITSNQKQTCRYSITISETGLGTNLMLAISGGHIFRNYWMLARLSADLSCADQT